MKNFIQKILKICLFLMKKKLELYIKIIIFMIFFLQKEPSLIKIFSLIEPCRKNKIEDVLYFINDQRCILAQVVYLPKYK